MNGLDLGSISQAINQLMSLFSVPIAFIGLSVTEIAKKWLPDNIEGKWIPVIGIAICAGLSLLPAFKSNLLAGLVTGAFITGGYSVLMSFVKNIGTGGNDNAGQSK